MLIDAADLRPSGITIATLAIILGASIWVFTALCRRETLRRHWTVISQWAKARGLRLIEAAQGTSIDSAMLKLLAPHHPRPQLLIEGKRYVLTRTLTDSASTVLATRPVWHLLIMATKGNWPPTGLRPTVHAVSALDLFSLSSFPSLSSTQRFMLFGTDSLAAKSLAESAAATLLPPDVGLLLHDKWLVLDFTSRKFDTIEFARIIDLAEQLAPRLESAVSPGQ